MALILVYHGHLRNSKKSKSKISEISKSIFRDFQIDFGCRVKSKTWNNFSDIYHNSDFSKFPICHFSIFFLRFFFFLQMFFQGLSFCKYSTTLKYRSTVSLTTYGMVLVFMFWSTKYIHNIEYKMYLQNEKREKLWVFVDFSNKRSFELI